MTDDAWSVLVTGPISAIERWCAAAEQVGWRAIPFPLVEVEMLEVEVLRPSDPVPDWIAVTSANALPALAAAHRARPELAGSRLVCVGEATAERARELGLPEPLLPAPGAQDASGLAETLLAHAREGERVLWPRGDSARELGERLRAAGLVVTDPVVYRTALVELAGEPPRTDAVFFASPSAVAAWRAEERTFAPAAIAIGWTTYDALETVEHRFSMRLPLVTPAIQAFQDCLRSFHPSR